MCFIFINISCTGRDSRHLKVFLVFAICGIDVVLRTFEGLWRPLWTFEGLSWFQFKVCNMWDRRCLEDWLRTGTPLDLLPAWAQNPRDQNQGVYRKLNERKSSVLAEMSLNKTQETRIREFLENQLRVESRDAIIIKAKTYISWQKNNSRSF